MSLKLGVALVSTSSFYESFWANVFFKLSFIYGNLPAAGSIEPYSLLGGFADRRPDYITKFICCLTDKFASAGPINTKLTSYLLLCRTNCRSLYRVTGKPDWCFYMSSLTDQITGKFAGRFTNKFILCLGYCFKIDSVHSISIFMNSN